MDEHAAAGGVATATDVGTVVRRTEEQVEALRDATADLAAVLPTRIEAAISRALESPDGTALHGQVLDVQRAVAAIAGALEEERLGRIGDLEVMVDLIAADADATRAELRRVDDRIAALASTVSELRAAVDRLTPVVATVAEKLDRRVRISVHTEPGAQPFGTDTSQR